MTKGAQDGPWMAKAVVCPLSQSQDKARLPRRRWTQQLETWHKDRMKATPGTCSFLVSSSAT